MLAEFFLRWPGVDGIIRSVIQGIPVGAVYALIALGFVLTYKTAGVFNLAFGAQAFVAAAVHWELHVWFGWNIVFSAAIAVLVVSPAVGLLLDLTLFRHLRSAPSAARMVTTIGLLVAIPNITKLVMRFERHLKTGGTGGADGLFSDRAVYYPFGDSYPMTRDELVQIAVGLAAVLGLGALFRYSGLGLRMRAVVESTRLAELSGVNSLAVGSFAWALSSAFAGMAGILIAPRFQNVEAQNFFELVIAGVAAAALGGLVSLPKAFAGAIGLGIASTLLPNILQTNSVLARGLNPSLPFVVLFAWVVLAPSLRGRRDVVDPLSGVAPPPPAPASDERSVTLTLMTRIFWAGVGLLLAWSVFAGIDSFWRARVQEMIAMAIIFLSITVMTGMAGQISLCQATFAAIGAFTATQLADQQGVSILAGMLIGALVAAAVGAVLSLPLIRLGGIWLSLATLGFALFFHAVIADLSWVGGGITKPATPRPLIGSIDFAADRAFIVLELAIFAVAATVVVLVRGGTTGRFLAALRGSEIAAASIGISQVRARVTAFALSAGIAGLGGALLASAQGNVNYPRNFGPFVGLFLVVIVVTLGSRTIEGAIQAAFGFVMFQPLILERAAPWLINHVQPFLHVERIPAVFREILFGLGALTYAKHPEGILEFQKRKSLNSIQRRLDRRAARTAPPESPPDASETVTVGGVS
jgi:branched-subunit amino acid ABC-type transport system permease component